MKKKRLLNTSEHLTETSIRKAIEGSKFSLYAQIPIRNILEPEEEDNLKRIERQSFQAQVIDFLLCDSDGMPALVIEFDGPTHEMGSEKKRDIRKNRFFSLAGIPLVRINDRYLEKHDKVTILEYLLQRFVAWHKEQEEILDEVNDYIETLSSEDFERLTEGGILDPVIDPSFIFDQRHKFPGLFTLSSELLARFGIITDYNTPEEIRKHSTKANKFRFSYQGGLKGQLEEHEYTVQNKYWLTKTDQSDVFSQGEFLRNFDVEINFTWTFPLIDDLDLSTESPAEYYFRTKDWPIGFHNIPGISTPELTENLAEYLALKRLKEWAEHNLTPTSQKLD